jgi:Mg/Co/Ni transporter MgtE
VSVNQSERLRSSTFVIIFFTNPTLAYLTQLAFPERMLALTVTLIFEIPVLLMISGGSDALCQLVGRRRYQLLMGFIPLTSAISGNVGLQASTLTTRAISHTHVTPTNYLPWFLHEIGAAVVLGVGMGLLLGSIAFYASGLDFAFGFTILFAQFISIVTAGCTGTFAPLLFSFIFRRDSGKWGGPLETAIQDIVGSFAMVIISYQILKFLGPGPISPDDVCSAAPTDDLA